jgi:hypothetical protein
MSDHDDKVKSEGTTGMMDKLKAKLPKWFTEPLTDLRAWKTLLRCMLAVLGTIILVVCQPCTSRFFTSFHTHPADYENSFKCSGLSSILRLDRVNDDSTLYGFEHVLDCSTYDRNGHVSGLGLGMCGYGCGVESEESSVISFGG